VTIRVDHVSHSFGTQEVLRDVSLVVPTGRTVVLLGPSGVGKSVLLKIVAGLLGPDQGDVWIDNVSIFTASERAVAGVRRNLGLVFQSSALFDSLTVGENILFGLQDGLGRALSPELRAQVEERLAWVNLDPDVIGKYPGELSGGMQKRVAIARAIAGGQRSVLYDEPTSGLDPLNSDTVAQLIRQLQRELGVTSLVVTHDLELTATVADTVALLDRGKIQAEVPVSRLKTLDHPLVQARRPRSLEFVA
jgi:phospholipid/cholesterol/gamma-HCH transport system ATP-binding protein